MESKTGGFLVLFKDESYFVEKIEFLELVYFKNPIRKETAFPHNNSKVFYGQKCHDFYLPKRAIMSIVEIPPPKWLNVSKEEAEKLAQEKYDESFEKPKKLEKTDLEKLENPKKSFFRRIIDKIFPPPDDLSPFPEFPE